MLAELSRGARRVRLEPDDSVRNLVAKELGLRSVSALTCDLDVRPWMDGVEITGRINAVVGQVCGVSLDDFEQAVVGEVDLRLVPAGSVNAPEPSTDVEIDPFSEHPDPPEVLQDDRVDLAAIAQEHLALAIDPFPRKPGAVFEYSPAATEESPFAVLSRLRDAG